MKQTVFFKFLLLQVVMLVAGTDIQAKEAYAVMTAGDFPKLTFYYDDQKASRNGMDIGPFGSQQERGWHDISGMHIQSTVRDVEFDSSFADYTGLTSTAYWFYGCQQLKTITGIENLKTDNVTDMSYMFYGCTYIESLDVSHFNTSKVTNMSGMFYGCRCVTSLDLSHFDTSNVTNMGNMFNECASLTSIDVSHFNTSKVTDMNCLFYECRRLTSLDVTNFDTSNVTDMHGLFSGCRALTSLDVSNFDTSNVTQMYWMFEECDALVSLDLSNFNTSNVTGMDKMFAHSYALSSIDLSSFNTSKVTSMGYMFVNCKSLTVLDLSTFDTSNVTSMSGMFNNCESLTTIYGSNWDTSKSVHPYSNFSMFEGCNKLVGGKGTTYYWRNVDETYARIDQGKDAPGYFTEKDPVDVQPTTTDYRPFVEEGKVWHVDYSITNSSHYSDQYILTNNEVVKNGKTYISMSWNSNNEAEIYDAVLLREENHKVYIFDENKQEERLIFDYSLKAGDTFEAFSYDVRKMMSYKVLSVGDYTEGPLITRYDYDENGDSVIEHQRYLRKWTVCRVGDESYQKTWIEGVGSLEGPLGNISEYSPNPRYLAYVENYSDESYLPFSFHDELGQVHGCNLPTGKTTNREDNIDRLTYELEGDRLHVYGEIFTNCGPNHYIYFFEEPTDDPLVHKLRYRTIDLAPHATCAFLHATDFYVSGFDPNLSYIVVDNQGVEHPVINKTPQMAYRSFVEDGKVWKVGGKDSGNPVKFVTYYYFDGDTIIGGKTCKQMMCQRYLSPDCPHSSYYDFWAQLPSLSKVGAWYEEDKKVYVCMEGTQGMQMLYDFSLEANDTLILNDYQPYYTVRPKQTGGIKGFKGVYRDIMLCGQDIYITTWLEGVGGIDGPLRNVYPENESNPQFLMSCTVGDEVIYMNDEYEDGATPEGARKDRIDFTHTIKIKPKAPKVKAPRRIEAMSSLYGEYNDQQLGINLNSLDDAYQVSITDEAGKAVYEKTVDAGTIVGLNIDISTYAKGRYTVTVENSREVFTGIFETLTTGIEEARNKKAVQRGTIYDLQGRRVDSPSRRGVYIKDGRKIIR